MKLYSLSNSREFANKISTHLGIELSASKTEIFADGEVNPEFLESVRNESIVIIAQIQMPYSNIMELLLMCDAAKRNDVKEINVVIPYLPHSRQERRDTKRSPISARVIADMLQNAGINHIISMDLHIGAIEGFYKIPFDKLSPFEIFLEEIKKLEIPDITLVSPDFGFMKKMEAYQDALGFDMSVIRKKRIAANKIDKMELIGDVTGKNAIIIDDIVDTAGTLVKASDLLLEKGAKSVTVFATHGVLSGNFKHVGIQAKDTAYGKIADSKIKNVYISNTMLLNSKLYNEDGLLNKNMLSFWSNNKVQIVDVSRIFADAIKKLNTH